MKYLVRWHHPNRDIVKTRQFSGPSAFREAVRLLDELRKRSPKTLPQIVNPDNLVWIAGEWRSEEAGA